jgi:DtxR family transcriptional regulator, Mn-dependent transcriptional regulator
MTDPLQALIVAVFILVIAAIILWPKFGLVSQFLRFKSNNRRVQVEDALKHLYHCEFKKQPCTLESVAGALSINSDNAATLMARLESMELLTSKEKSFHLTTEGRSYALRVIRVHRLWERYLADETSLTEIDWHAQAEKKEHQMSEDEANSLAAQIGNPSFDPHGDPIPTASGELPPLKGLPLTDLAEGEIAGIIHIEDEPPTVYAQLVAQGLHPGMQVQMLVTTRERIVFSADGDEKVLAPVFAANITVIPLAIQKQIDQPFETLVSLSPDEKGVVIGISKACRGQQRRRLMDLGITPGTEITMEMVSAGGDPIAYQIRGATIALRKDQAGLIHIRKKEIN